MSNIESPKHVVITGGTSGIGLELVRQLYKQNRISVIARPSRRLKELRQAFPNATVVEADLSDSNSVATAADAIVKLNKPVDVLINNAAVQFTAHFMDDDFCVETIKREIDVNLTTPAMLIYLLLPALTQSGNPIIMNINSGLGLVPKTSSAVYCATKGGMNILTQSLRNQFEGTNVRVAQAFLPLVDTQMTQGRGSGKLSAAQAACEIIHGLTGNGSDIYVGKVKLLRLIMRLSPALARRIMKAA